MAHGREEPDIVLNIRYAGASEIRAVSRHEVDRTPDGASAIDPARRDLNKVLVGPKTQHDALEALWASGVLPPAKQAETPYVQLVLSASPSFFRDAGQGRGEWNKVRLDEWTSKTLDWLKDEYGADLVHASIHLDEDTPHIHALVVPTYEKRPRKPGRPRRGETDEQFKARKRAAEDAFGVRAVGRSSCEQWSRQFARRLARKSYHKAMEPLGLGYGRDFIEDGQPSPDHLTTGQWVRQEAARVAEQRAAVAEDQATALADAERLAAKSSAFVAASIALAEEVRNGTLRREEGRIRAAAPQRLKDGLPALEPAIRAAADVGDVRAKVEADAAAVRQLKTEAEADAAAAAEMREKAAAELVAAQAARKEAESLSTRLAGMLRRVSAWMRRPDLPAAAREEGAALLREAGRPVPEPKTGTKGGVSSVVRHAMSPKNPVQEAPAPAPVLDGPHEVSRPGL